MTDLMNIGRSGLMAYRTALGVVGENIANVDTKGYLRRDTALAENGFGGGVDVADISRAFDALLVTRNRDAQTNLAAAETQLTHLRNLEERLLPGVEGVQLLLDGFFDAMDSLAMAPADTGLRAAVLSAGQTLAGGVADLAVGLDDLAAGIVAETGDAIGRSNDILRMLGLVQAQIVQVDKTSAQNGLLDQRDRLLDDLSNLVQIDVSLDARGIATVRLGAGEAGPLLLRGVDYGQLEQTPDGQIKAMTADQNAPVAVPTLVGGVLGGLLSAQGSVAQTIRDLDAWAGRMASEMNSAHQRGITQDGQQGLELFRMTGWTQSRGALIRSDAVADITLRDAAAAPQGPLLLVYAADVASWQLRDAAGTTLATGNPEITYSGLQITMRGTPRDGDRITLAREDGAARHLQMVLSDPRQIAAAGPLVAGPAAGNQGTGTIAVRRVDPPVSGQADVTTLLSASGTEFLDAGVVGVIPAGSGTVDLSAQPRLRSFEMALPIGATPTALTVDGTEIALPAGMQLADVIAGLNAGDLRSADDQTLRDMGLTALMRDGVITVLVDEGATGAAAISLTTTAGPVTALQVSDESPASDLMLFTRDGRQLSGPPLGPAAAMSLLTVANGFDPDAVYRTDDLATSRDFAGLVRQPVVAGGAFATLIGGAGGITTWPAGSLAPETAPMATGLEMAGVLAEVDLPAGSSAARKADLLGDAFPVSVKAWTGLELDLPATGRLSMQLAGSNLAPVTVSADLTTEGVAALALAVNAVSGSTGITAELSRDQTRIRLIHAEGADITLNRVTHDTAAPVTLRRLAPDGDSLEALTLDTSGAQAVRVGGVVTLSANAAFGITQDGSFQAAARDPFLNGLIDVQSSEAGSTLQLSPAAPIGEDTIPRRITLTGGDGRALTATASVAGDDAATVATRLLTDLRRNAPVSQLVGSPLGSLPADGASMRVLLGDQVYAVQMVDGGPVVDGPEQDRISASFDASNRLVLTTAEGTLDGSALQLPTDAGEAGRFGMAAGQAPLTTIIGQPVDPAGLPASFDVMLGVATFEIEVTAGGVTTPPGFPGTALRNPLTGAVEISFDPRAGRFAVPAQGQAAAAGFDTADLVATRAGDQLILSATDGRLLEIGSPVTGSGQGLRLSGLPAMDLLVVLGDNGALRLSGSAVTAEPVPRAQEIRVLDADQGLVGLFDTASGAFLAERRLGSDGAARFGALEVTLGRGFVTGDVFSITPGTGREADGSTIGQLGTLRARDPVSGIGGYAAGFASLQHRIGAQVAATQMRVTSLAAESESATRAIAARSGVDLDAEAAKLMQLQQAYQANAQSMKTAREIFDTLMAAL